VVFSGDSGVLFWFINLYFYLKGVNMDMDLISLMVGGLTGSALMFAYKCQCDSEWAGVIVREGTQAYLVREHLERGNKIDHKFARENLGIKNLSSAVDKLRKAGVEVKVERDDNGSYYTL
jgi:hypothetical protein